MDQIGRPSSPATSPRAMVPVDADDLPPWLASALATTGMDLADALIAEGDDVLPDARREHDELVLRILAPALGDALDTGHLDPARAAVYLREASGHTARVIAAAVAISLSDAAIIPVDALGDALADLLDHLAGLDDAGLLEQALVPAPAAVPAGGEDMAPVEQGDTGRSGRVAVSGAGSAEPCRDRPTATPRRRPRAGNPRRGSQRTDHVERHCRSPVLRERGRAPPGRSAPSAHARRDSGPGHPPRHPRVDAGSPARFRSWKT